MKTLKITEEAHKNLVKTQILLYELTGIKLTFSQIIERFYIDMINPKNKRGINK